MKGMRAALAATLLLNLTSIAAQAQESEPLAIAEVGASGDWGIRKGGSAYGPSFAVEVTPIESWLELEAGVTPFFSSGQTEWDTDIVFKKPFELTDNFEFMVGLGPEWAHRVNGGHATDSVGGEAVLDFMFWPWPQRKIGLYVEPSYGYSFGSGRDQSLSVSAGLLIPIR